MPFVFFGLLIGLALGLTGGGGGIFAIPLLVYGLEVVPQTAVGISLAAVCLTALAGAIPRYLRGEVEVSTGLLFAFSGMLGAPVGSLLSGMLSEQMLLVSFSLLMLVIAQRMWRGITPLPPVTSGKSGVACIFPSALGVTEERVGSGSTATAVACIPSTVGLSSVGQPKKSSTCDIPTHQYFKRATSYCQRDAAGNLRLTTRCGGMLLLLGLLTGILSGLYGVGGGFVIVPALLLFSSMPLQRAIGTSLAVIVLVSLSGVISFLASGRELPIEGTLLFAGGGLLGMVAGGKLSKQLNERLLQKVFAVGVIAAALVVLWKSVLE